MKWSFDRIFSRSVCFGGGGGGGSNKVQETEAQRANAEIAMKNLNDYMQFVEPTMEKMRDDLNQDPTNKENLVKGQVNANLAQKLGTPAIDPNKAVSSSAVEGMANPLSDGLNKARQGVDSQQLAGKQALVDIGMGKNTTAQIGMADLARQSTADAINNQVNSNLESTANMSAAASGLGSAVYMGEKLYNNGKK